MSQQKFLRFALLMADMEACATIVYPGKRHQVVARDPDDAVVDCAVESRSLYIVSGDWRLRLFLKECFRLRESRHNGLHDLRRARALMDPKGADGRLPTERTMGPFMILAGDKSMQMLC